MLRPILDRVYLKRIEEESDSAIITPDIAKQKSNRGKVVAIGRYAVLSGHLLPMSDFVNEGDTVLFGEFNYQPINIDGEELLVVRVADILGVDPECGQQAELSDSSAPTTTVIA